MTVRPEDIVILTTWPKDHPELTTVYVCGDIRNKVFQSVLGDAMNDPDYDYSKVKTKSIGFYDFWVMNAAGVL